MKAKKSGIFSRIFSREIKTELLTAVSPDPAENSRGIARVAEILKNGGTAAIPTETVYGLAADALSSSAVKKIFKAKERPQDNPLIVHIANHGMLRPLVLDYPESARLLTEKFWPGPLTIILEKSGLIPDEICVGLETVAIRMPSHPVALEVIKAVGLPLAAPSANISGSPSATAAPHCIRDLSGKIDAILDGGPCEIGVESTVIDLTGGIPVVLRPGAVTLEQIREILPETVLSEAAYSEISKSEAAPSPGMKYKHYSPRAKVILISGSGEKYAEYVNSKEGENVYALCFDEESGLLKVPYIIYGKGADNASQAAGLFSALRELDDRGAEIVYAHSPEESGVGLAVYNRLLRAAAFNIIKL